MAIAGSASTRGARSMLVRSLEHSMQRVRLAHNVGSSASASASVVVRRSFVHSSAVLRKPDSPTGNDPTSARRPDVDSVTGEPRNASTASTMQQRQSMAKSLAEFTNTVALQQQESGSDMFRRSRLSGPLTSFRKTEHVQATSPALAPSGYSMAAVPMKTDPVLKAFINNLMRDGKKASATRYVVNMLRYLGHILHADPLPAMKEAIRVASPIVRMQTRKEGGKNTQVPLALFPRQSRRRGIIAILDASSKRNDASISVRMAKEIIAVLDGSSAALTRKMDVHKLATVNRGNTGVRV